MGEVLQRGGTVRVRPLGGGGNESQVSSPAGGRFYVKGLENGDYEAVDELGNRRVFTVTGGPGEEVTLEEYASAEEIAGKPLPANYGTEAPLVRDESHAIQHGLPAMTVDGPVLSRDGSENPADLSPASVAPEDDPEFEPEELKGEALHKRAAELEIEGRSDMSADELRAAVARVEGE